MDIFRIMILGIWDNVLNRSIAFGQYSFPIWVPTGFAIISALIIRFLGGGKVE
ncbi:hypothetical protein GKZ28_09100 [Clostridium chromiireducens]|uniref:Uncharacterized protein n=1 Tax=Clostridium chromiireducens TaxID=225345 RepID=A0A964W251_9CLOT|nr:hypothetical protein [Clostridium chromiireducens]MVX63850.1 hypothetical protein [Clostridium chromiireducens]